MNRIICVGIAGLGRSGWDIHCRLLEPLSDKYRIVAVADSLDAMISERPYKQAWPLDRSAAEIIDRRGREYCPSVADAFERLYRSGKLRTLAQITGGEPLPGTKRAA